MSIDLTKATPVRDENNKVPATLKLTVVFTAKQGGKGGFASGMLGKIAGKLDLDALLIGFNSLHEVIACCEPDDKDPFGNGSVVHQGDGKAARGSDARETITINTGLVRSSVQGFVLAVVAFGKTEVFSKLGRLEFILSDGNGNELAQQYMTIERGGQGQILFRLVRDGEDWIIEPLHGVVGSASQWEDVAEEARRRLPIS